MRPAAQTQALIENGIAAEALVGLSASPKWLPPKLFYDATGCSLFRRITELPEYYLTRTELAVLEALVPELSGMTPPRPALVEYGASDEAKAALLFGPLGVAAYVPIDIAWDAVMSLRARVTRAYPGIHVHPIVTDFVTPTSLPLAVTGLPCIGFFPGSTIGNLDPSAAAGFLRRARRTLGHAASFVLGVDLEKAPEMLLAAYDDAAGVTAEFNLNVLARLNREARADFELARFGHRVAWNAAEHRIEMHLESLADQVVHVAGVQIGFRKGERMHTENSHKFTEPRLTALARHGGWRVERIWTDAERFFAVALLR